ncbi:uncharacterized protein [Physcomitrium patens]|uniref:uncharacterized protein isoform X2 n=1 Tax=Physcomitrium patens TaxID=3218 RepID=UPI003CCD7FE1
MIPPLSIRLRLRPNFLSFILTAICSLVKSYLTVGDAALYTGLMAVCAHELTENSVTCQGIHLGKLIALQIISHVLGTGQGAGQADLF